MTPTSKCAIFLSANAALNICFFSAWKKIYLYVISYLKQSVNSKAGSADEEYAKKKESCWLLDSSVYDIFIAQSFQFLKVAMLIKFTFNYFYTHCVFVYDKIVFRVSKEIFSESFSN